MKNKTSRYFVVLNVSLSWIIINQFHFNENKSTKSNFHLPVLSDLWLDSKLLGNSRLCQVILYFFNAIQLERQWKCPWKLSLKSAWIFFLETCTHHAWTLTTLAQVMAWCLMAPSNYLNQSSLIINMHHCDTSHNHFYPTSVMKISLNMKFQNVTRPQWHCA